MNLNYYAISKVLGTPARPIGETRFGTFGLLKAVGELAAAVPPGRGRIPLDMEQIRTVVEAFERIRDGYAPDRILWDTDLAGRFYSQTAALGVAAPPEVLGRALLVVRKNPGRYAEHGIRLSPTTKRDPQPSIVHEHAHAIEFSLMKLRYRFGVSIDDILMSPRLSSEFVGLASDISPGVLARDLRVGALYIRKNRNWDKSLAPLETPVLQRQLREAGPLTVARRTELPESPGIFELWENGQYLYVTASPDLRRVARHFTRGPALDALRDDLWQPNREAITLHYCTGDRFRGAPIETWQLRLVCDLRPVFNWPVHKPKTAVA